MNAHLGMRFDRVRDTLATALPLLTGGEVDGGKLDTLAGWIVKGLDDLSCDVPGCGVLAAVELTQEQP